jgi:SAM-dependent methyltransferase
MKIPKHIQEILNKKKDEVIKLDLGCANHCPEGFIGMDLEAHPGVIVQDLENFPWKFPSETATLITAGHLVEHIEPHKGVFIKFMNEAWRVLKYGGQFYISTPYAGSRGYYADPTHCNPCSKDTWGYFDPLNPTLYDIYRPLPWQVKNITFQVEGNMEILLVKRRIDKKYNVNPAYLNYVKSI